MLLVVNGETLEQSASTDCSVNYCKANACKESAVRLISLSASSLKRNLTVSKEIRINDGTVTCIAVLNVLDADSEKTLKLCADGNLQQRRHVGGKKGCAVVLCEVFGVDEVAVAYSAGVFFAEGVQRGVGLVAGRLHLDGAELCAS